MKHFKQLAFLCLLQVLGLQAQNHSVRFRVDMNEFGGQAFQTVHLNGTFNNWCGSCNPMSDADNDGIWELDINLPSGEHEYKFTLNGWSHQETFISSDPCTKTSGTYINRRIFVNGPEILPAVCWESCTPCVLPEAECLCNSRMAFAGRIWEIKSYENYTWGPGGNYFSNHEDDVFVDDKGFLHLRIAQRNGKWYSTEVISPDTMGYGTYTFVVQGNLESLPANTVVGLFTWDNNTLLTHGNSEVDVEVARWGNVSEQRILQYSVQPVWFGGYNPERTFLVPTQPGDLNGVTAHRFVWTDTLITWTSWKDRADGPNVIGSWYFNLNNPPRVKIENGQTSAPIIIPGPGNTTHARFNFWLFNGAAPFDGQEHEIVIQSFSYEPLN